MHPVGRGFILSAFVIYGVSSPALSAPLPEQGHALSVKESIRLALKNNQGILMEEQEVAAREPEVLMEKGKFDPQLGLTLKENRTKRLTTSPFEPTELQTEDYNMQVTQKSLFGGRFELRFDNSRTSLIIPASPGERRTYSTDLSVVVSQSLLKGFGTRVNRAEITIASNNLTMSRQDFEAKAMNLVRVVGETYWDLLFGLQNVRLQEEAAAAAAALAEVNKAKVEEGLLPQTEVLVAEADAASRDEKVLLAQRDMKDVEERFRRLLNLAERSGLADAAIIPTDEPGVVPVEEDLSVLIATSLERRPELKRARMDLRNRGILVGLARNQRLPSLDLQGGAGVNGLGGNFSDDLDQLTSGDFYTWEVGLTATVPLGNRSASGLYQKRRHEEEKALLSTVDQEQAILLEVKEAARRATTDLKRVEAAAKSRLLSEKRVETERERVDLGMATSHDLLEAQSDLTDSKTRELAALIDYNKSVLQLQRATGTILQDYGIALAEKE